MQIYTVTGSPVLVRQIPSADAKIMNVLPTGSKLYIIANEEGWLRTSSGYYVFLTDDVTIDTNPAPTLNAINVATRGIRLASPSTVYIDPELTDEDNSDIPSGATLRDIKGDTPEPGAPASGDDGRDISVDHAVELSEKYNGKTIKANGPGTCLVMNDDGTWTETEIPEAMLEEQNGTRISGIDPSGNVQVMAPDGKIYLVDGARISVADANSDGSTGDYTQFEIDQLQQENKDADNLIAEIMETLSDTVRAVTNASELKIEDIRTVFGMPYQFLGTTDPRPYDAKGGGEPFDDKKFGRKYMEKIVTRAPILVMQPGEAVFLRGYSDDVKERVMSEVLGVVGSVVGGEEGKSELDKMLNGGGEYYSFRLKHTDYFNCINGALRAVAILMGLENVEVAGLTASDGEVLGEIFKDLGQNQLGSFNWLLKTEHPLGGYYTGAVQFYINSEAQIQEGFSTGTRPSSLASKINQITDQAAEAMFVMGGIRADIAQTTGIGEGSDIGNTADDAAKLLGTDGTSGAGGGAAGSGLLHSIIGNISTLLAGGKMYFPEIWSDSQFSRSYNVTIKLDSPDADPLSVYLNIMVPLIHILGFVLPRSAGDNTYISPFLVRCFYKSMFHIDMGIITSCSVTKGDQGAWTQNGLPTQVTVQLSIKDLYSVMTQSRGVGANTLLSNPAQLDYLANLCGLNIAPSNFGRTFKLWWTMKGPQRVIDGVVNAGAKLITSAYTLFYNFANPTRWMM